MRRFQVGDIVKTINAYPTKSRWMILVLIECSLRLFFIIYYYFFYYLFFYNYYLLYPFLFWAFLAGNLLLIVLFLTKLVIHLSGTLENWYMTSEANNYVFVYTSWDTEQFVAITVVQTSVHDKKLWLLFFFSFPCKRLWGRDSDFLKFFTICNDFLRFLLCRGCMKF